MDDNKVSENFQPHPHYTMVVNLIKQHGPICFTGFAWLVKARELATGGLPVKSEWLNHKQSLAFMAEPNIHKETSYDECISGSLRVEDQKLIFRIVLHDGSLHDGSRMEERCQFNITLDGWCQLFDHVVIDKLSLVAYALMEAEDRKAAKLRHQHTVRTLMQDLSP